MNPLHIEIISFRIREMWFCKRVKRVWKWHVYLQAKHCQSIHFQINAFSLESYIFFNMFLICFNYSLRLARQRVNIEQLSSTVVTILLCRKWMFSHINSMLDHSITPPWNENKWMKDNVQQFLPEVIYNNTITVDIHRWKIKHNRHLYSWSRI